MPEGELRESSNPEKVLPFLIANDDEAFETPEIAREPTHSIHVRPFLSHRQRRLLNTRIQTYIYK